MQYITILKRLKHSIDNKGENEIFKKSLQQFKQDFEQEVSTKFLRDLHGSLNFRDKTKRISYLLRATKLKTKKVLKFSKGWKTDIFKTDVIEYGHDKKGTIYKNPCELSTEEKEQINQLKEIKNKNDVDLIPRASNDFKDRQNRRNAFNIGGGVYIKNVRSQEFGSEFIGTSKKTFYMVQI